MQLAIYSNKVYMQEYFEGLLYLRALSIQDASQSLKHLCLRSMEERPICYSLTLSLRWTQSQVTFCM